MPQSLQLESPGAISELPYVSFLLAYPHPAFLLPAVVAPGKLAPSLVPIWCNPMLVALLTGSRSVKNSRPVTPDGPLATSFVESLRSTEVRRIGEWMMSDDPDVLLTMRPLWIDQDYPDIQLQLTKTRLGKVWAVTSLPRSPLPPIPSTPTTIAQRRARDEDLRISLNLRQQANLQVTNLRDSSMVAMVESFDWASTPLGPRESWPQSLITSLGVCLSSSVPGAVWWGPEAVIIYNDAYVPTAGSKHPRIFGQAGAVAWSELWEEIGPIVTSVFDGASVWKQDDLLLFERLTNAGLPEENYYDWSYRPVNQEDGTIGGILNDCFDTTQKILGQRRMRCLSDLTGSTGLASSPTEFAQSVIHTLSREAYARDVPFAALYFCSSSGPMSTAQAASPSPATKPSGIVHVEPVSTQVTITLTLAGAIGIPDGHPAAPESASCVVELASQVPASPQLLGLTGLQTADLTTSISSGQSRDYITSKDGRRASAVASSSTSTATSSGSSGTATGIIGAKSASPASVSGKDPCPWPFAEALLSGRVMHLDRLPESVKQGLIKRGWGDEPREAVLLPISLESARIPNAVLVLGLNTRRPYDAEYASFVDITRLTLSSTLGATLGREADLQRAEHYAQLDAAKTAFFSNVSHELRTPLTLIGGPLDDVIADLPEGRTRSNLKLAARNVRRLSRLVDSLMDFSKLAANKLEGHFQPVQLGIFTADLASLFRSLIERSGIQYEIVCDERVTQPLCYIDPDFWEKIVFNLIGNAFKYTFTGTITVRVGFTSTHAVFSVQDTGIGISEGDQSKIFDRFHRVQAVSRSHEGTGIGLALTKELVGLHGGELTVESAAGDEEHGSKFTVKLLLGKEHLPMANTLDVSSTLNRQGSYAKNIVEEARMWSMKTSGASIEGATPSESEGSGSSDSSGSTGPGRFEMSSLMFSKSDVVLLVDDNLDMRRYIKSILAPYCTILEAGNGKEALETVAHTTPDLILSDVMMPIMDGYALLHALRARKETAMTPVILITAKSDSEETAEGLLSGADDYLTKPFKSSELVARVHLHMNLGKSRIELEARFQERTRELAQLLELSPVAIIRSARDGSIFYVNPVWYEISGREKGSPLDEWPESLLEEDFTTVMDFWRRIHKPPSPGTEPDEKNLLLDFRWRNGRWCQLQAERTEGGGTLCSITDTSHQRLYEAQKLAYAQEREAIARRRAEEADERRKEAEERRRGQELLIDVTSHELRQPVSAIINCSSLVRSNMTTLRDTLYECLTSQSAFVPEEQLLETLDDDLEALDSIYQCGLAQERIANDVLSLSRIQLNVLSIHPGPFRLVSEVRRICSIFRNEVKMKKINLEVGFGESLPLLGVSYVACDKARFGQVITNLMSNAIKFTDTSAGKRDIIVNVEVALSEPPDGSCKAPPLHISQPGYVVPPNTPVYIYVSVTDSGPGLQPDDLTLLFKRFQQGSNSHDVFGGSGLGLFVSRSLCDLMGGRISVDSEYGQGATFRFFIKSLAAPTPPVGLDSPAQSTPSSSSISPGSTSEAVDYVAVAGAEYHILITEDNIINQTVLNRQLKKAGCSTELASNGLQAIERVQKLATINDANGRPRHFDAILLDVEMPVMDGLTAVRQIRKMEASGELPGGRNWIFALTGNAREGQIENIRNAGMDDVLIKPYRIDDIMARIRSTRRDHGPRP